MELTIKRSVKLKGIPGASGVTLWQSRIFLIGDNTPYLYELDGDFRVIGKKPIYRLEHLGGQGIPKRKKPDFEAFEAIGDKELVVFGSGSKYSHRNSVLQVFPGQRENWYKAHKATYFYQELKKRALSPDDAFNIEACAEYKGQVYLFCRTSNVIFQFKYVSLINYFLSKTYYPEVQTFRATLPAIQGLPAGFSGATITDNGLLLVTASVEDTPNAYDDGEILGSFLGMVPVNKLHLPEAWSFIPITYGGDPLKIESVAVLKKRPGRELDLVFVTDSDGGPSLMMEARLTW